MVADYDLVIRGGEIHDGMGGEPFIGDVAIRQGLIAAIGGPVGAGLEEIDARDNIVTPGFIDVHTHYDGQATWETCMAPSSSHGVTSVVMGNCGVGFAPCHPDEHDLLVNLLEGVEDIPEVVMDKGLPWNWVTFPEYLDALAQRRLDIDIAAQLPHSALRVFVMGKRGADREVPTDSDLASMRKLTAEAVRAGAIGVSTSRNLLHRTRDGKLAPSVHSEEIELQALAAGLRDANAGVFQIIPEVLGDAEAEFGLMRRLAETAQRPLSFSLLQMPVGDPEAWRKSLALLKQANDDGIAMRAQVFPRPVGFLYGLDLSFHPFSLHPSFGPLRDIPLAGKVRAMRDPGMRARLLAEQPEDSNPVSLRIVENFKFSVPMGDPPNYEPNLADQIWRQAESFGMSVPEYAYDRLLEADGTAIFFMPAANYRDGNLNAAREMAADSHSVMGLGDGGAHYGMICDASYTTYYLQNWVRDALPENRIPLPDAIRALTLEPAQLVGLNDRGRIAVGYRADVNVIALQNLRLRAPTVVRDLPANGRRLRQGADGYTATVVKGEVTYRNGVYTGALPGRLIRGAQAAPNAA